MFTLIRILPRSDPPKCMRVNIGVSSQSLDVEVIILYDEYTSGSVEASTPATICGG